MQGMSFRSPKERRPTRPTRRKNCENRSGTSVFSKPRVYSNCSETFTFVFAASWLRPVNPAHHKQTRSERHLHLVFVPNSHLAHVVMPGRRAIPLTRAPARRRRNFAFVRFHIHTLGLKFSARVAREIPRLSPPTRAGTRPLPFLRKHAGFPGLAPCAI